MREKPDKRIFNGFQLSAFYAGVNEIEMLTHTLAVIVIARASSSACVTALMQLIGKETHWSEGSSDPKASWSSVSCYNCQVDAAISNRGPYI